MNGNRCTHRKCPNLEDSLLTSKYLRRIHSNDVTQMAIPKNHDRLPGRLRMELVMYKGSSYQSLNCSQNLHVHCEDELWGGKLGSMMCNAAKQPPCCAHIQITMAQADTCFRRMIFHHAAHWSVMSLQLTIALTAQSAHEI